MQFIVLVLALATFVSTLFGGMLIFKFKAKLHYFFAFAVGSIIAVAFLDLLPESLEIAAQNQIPIRTIMIVIVLAFFFYSLLEKYVMTHHLHEEETHSHNEEDSHGHIMGPIGAGSLVIHSFLDGAAIGVAFQASYLVGLIVALAVVSHDITDGINTVIIMLKNKQSAARARIFLFMDALAPMCGVLFTSILIIPASFLAYLLAFFVGEFLYIGAASLLPETHLHNSKYMGVAMFFGVVLMMVLTALM